jgi:hypothetical protein
MENGVEKMLRCTCDWERAYWERLEKTVHPDFWKNPATMKTLTDWDPPVFKTGSEIKFQALIDVQKANVMHRLNDFCFKRTFFDEKTGEKRYALCESVRNGRNIFIRGPIGSGRGLLVGVMKVMAAVRSISATPNPGEWANLKGSLLEAESWNKTGDAAKIQVYGKYGGAQLLTIENIRGESGSRRFGASTIFDDMLMKRQKGSMIVTSTDFVRQIGDTIGSVLPGALESQATIIVLMFSVHETNAILENLQKKHKVLRSACSSLAGDAVDKKSSLTARMDKKEALQVLEDTFYFETAFPNIPVVRNKRGDTGNMADSILYQMRMSATIFSENAIVIDAFKKFEEEREENTIEYQERLKKTYSIAIKDCFLAQLMSDREMLVAGRMVSRACGGKDEIDAFIRAGKQLQETMAKEA